MDWGRALRPSPVAVAALDHAQTQAWAAFQPRIPPLRPIYDWRTLNASFPEPREISLVDYVPPYYQGHFLDAEPEPVD